jgi:hypothetical protein
LNSPVCLNGRAGKKRLSKPIIDLLPELLVRALARHDDFIVTCETDPDKKKKIPVISGQFCYILLA